MTLKYLLHSGTYSIIVAGGWNGNSLSSVELLGDVNCSLPILPYAIRAGPQMFLHVNKEGNKEVVMCGGWPKKKSCLKLVNGAWNSFAELKRERSFGHVVASIEERTFIFGDGYINEKSSEVLEHGSDSWKEGPTVPGKGIDDGCGVAISKDELLLIGGDGTENRIIKYNVNSNTWNNETSLETGREYHKCAWFKNQIFITGGFSGLKSVDILTLDPLTISKGAKLNTGRHFHGLGLIHHQGNLKLTAFGGDNSNQDAIDSVEVYDEVTNIWKLSKSLKLSEKKSRFGFLSVPSHLICPHLYS